MSPIIAALRPALPILAFSVVSAALGGLMLLAAAWFTVQIVTEATAARVICACLSWLVGAVLLSLSSWLAHLGEAGFSARLRRDTASHLARMPMSAVSRYGGEALRRLVSQDIAALHHSVAHLPAEIATLAVVPLVTTILLLVAAGPLALLALGPGLLAAAYFLFVVPRSSSKHGTETVRTMTDIVTAVDDYARGIRVCRIYGAEAGAAANYTAATRRFTRNMVIWVRRVATSAALATALLQAAATYAIAYAVGYGERPEALAAMLIFGLAAVTPALRLGHGLDYVRAGRAAAARIVAVLREPTVVAPTVDSASPDLEIANLSIGYEGHTLIDSLSHTFTPASLTAITGPSGAGKSTLLRIIAGMESPARGTVRWPGAFGAVLLIPQGADVLAGTIRDTVALSAPEATDAKITAALRRAQLDLSPGTETTNLSGGERQRVNLARAFLSDAQVILLDEPTSALDPRTAKRIIRELRRLTDEQSKILVAVTHSRVLVEQATARMRLNGEVVTITGGVR